MVSCTQFPGNLISTEIDLILPRIKVDRGWNQMHVTILGRLCNMIPAPSQLCLGHTEVCQTRVPIVWSRFFFKVSFAMRSLSLKTRLAYLEHTWRAAHRDARLSRHANLIRISGSFHGDQTDFLAFFQGEGSQAGFIHGPHLVEPNRSAQIISLVVHPARAATATGAIQTSSFQKSPFFG